MFLCIQILHLHYIINMFFFSLIVIHNAALWQISQGLTTPTILVMLIFWGFIDKKNIIEIFFNLFMDLRSHAACSLHVHPPSPYFLRYILFSLIPF